MSTRNDYIVTFSAPFSMTETYFSYPHVGHDRYCYAVTVCAEVYDYLINRIGYREKDLYYKLSMDLPYVTNGHVERLAVKDILSPTIEDPYFYRRHLDDEDLDEIFNDIRDTVDIESKRICNIMFDGVLFYIWII